MGTQANYTLYCYPRPQDSESTASRLICEVNQSAAQLVPRWGTTRESQVLWFLLCFAAQSQTQRSHLKLAQASLWSHLKQVQVSLWSHLKQVQVSLNTSIQKSGHNSPFKPSREPPASLPVTLQKVSQQAQVTVQYKHLKGRSILQVTLYSNHQ